MHGDVPIWFYERGTREGTNALVSIAISDQNRQREPDIQAGAVVSGDAMLIADRRTKAVHRVSMSGGYQSRLALMDAVRMAVGPLGEAAAIERETGALLLIAPDGKHARYLPPARGMLRGPIDLAFDPLGHCTSSSVIRLSSSLRPVNFYPCSRPVRPPGRFERQWLSM